MARLQDRLDALGVEGLGDGDQPDRGGIAPCGFGGRCDAGVDLRQARRSRVGVRCHGLSVFSASFEPKTRQLGRRCPPASALPQVYRAFAATSPKGGQKHSLSCRTTCPNVFTKGRDMRIRCIAPLAAAAFAALGTAAAPALADSSQRIAGPHVHDNLAIYFVHGPGARGPVPLTLTEAVAKGTVQVIETGSVNELKIENKGDEDVFVQAGDIVKGGRQDRVLTVSLLLRPSSGPVSIDSFCVEPGRWSARGTEDPTRFTSAADSMPSRRALLIMAAPSQTGEATRPAAGDRQTARGETDRKQREVWDSVAKIQADLSAGVGSRVSSPQSASSLQLSLEHAKLKDVRAAYIAALEEKGLQDSDVIGYVAAINGKVVSANVYLSNGLFRKMWAKQLAAVATEAIGERSGAAVVAPAADSVQTFLGAAEKGSAQGRETAANMFQETRDSAGALYNETRGPSGLWLHKNYLAK